MSICLNCDLCVIFVIDMIILRVIASSIKSQKSL